MCLTRNKAYRKSDVLTCLTRNKAYNERNYHISTSGTTTRGFSSVTKCIPAAWSASGGNETDCIWLSPVT